MPPFVEVLLSHSADLLLEVLHVGLSIDEERWFGGVLSLSLCPLTEE